MIKEGRGGKRRKRKEKRERKRRERTRNAWKKGREESGREGKNASYALIWNGEVSLLFTSYGSNR